MKRLTKKDLALSLHSAGRTVEEIARALETHPSYVANVLAAAGKSTAKRTSARKAPARKR